MYVGIDLCYKSKENYVANIQAPHLLQIQGVHRFKLAFDTEPYFGKL